MTEKENLIEEVKKQILVLRQQIKDKEDILNNLVKQLEEIDEDIEKENYE